MESGTITMMVKFQSTLPARGATVKFTDGDTFQEFQSTLPRGERQQIWTNHICEIECFAQFITNKKGVKAICLL